MNFADALHILTQLSREAIEFHNGLHPQVMTENQLKLRTIEQIEAERVLGRCVQAANNFIACIPETHNRLFMEKVIFAIIPNHDDAVEYRDLYQKLRVDDTDTLNKVLERLEQTNQIKRDGDVIIRVRH